MVARVSIKSALTVHSDLTVWPPGTRDWEFTFGRLLVVVVGVDLAGCPFWN